MLNHKTSQGKCQMVRVGKTERQQRLKQRTIICCNR